MSLAALLSECAVPKGHAATHTSLNGGRFYVPGMRADELLDLYAKAAAKPGNNTLALAEQHRHVGPIVIDLDLRSPGADKVATPERINAFACALGSELAPLIAVDSFDMYVLDKPPRPHKECFKDGAHLVLPGVVTRPELQHVLRVAMLPHVRRIFVEEGACSNNEDDIYDEAVIQRNGWLLPGSRKPGEPNAWSLTRVLQWREGVLREISLPLPSMEDQVHLLSIRNKYDEAPLSDRGALLMHKEVARRDDERAAKDRAKEAAAIAVEDAGSADMSDVRELLAMLGDERAVGYKHWSRVGFCIRNMLGNGADALCIFHEFSARAGAEYDPAGCDRFWAGLQETGALRIGSLRRWACEDSPDSYAAWCASRRSGAPEQQAWPSQDWDCTTIVDAAARSLGGNMSGVSDARPQRDSVHFKLNDTDVIIKLADLMVRDDQDHQVYLHKDAPGVRLPGALPLAKTVAPSEGWTVSRPCKEKIILHHMGPPRINLEVDLCGDEIERAIMRYPDIPNQTKPYPTDRLKALLRDACRKAAQEHLVNLQVPQHVVNVVFDRCTFNIGGSSLLTALEGPRRTPDMAFFPILQQAGVLHDIVSINEKEVYVYKASLGIWRKQSLADGASIIRDAVFDGVLSGGKLNDVDAAYLMSCDGPMKVLRSMRERCEDKRFEERIDVLPDGCVAFDNGLYCALDDSLRPFAREDYVTRTIGYKYEPRDSVNADMQALIRTFYEQVFPVEQEREYLLRILADALFSDTTAKHFLCLMDERDGSNGKTTLMRAVEAVFKGYTAAAERSFLYQATTNSTNGHAANLLAYAGKRIACFDEPDPGSKFDTRKIKDLASGDAKIRGRGFNTGEMIDTEWETLIVIAANEANFPAVDASDKPFLRRMKVLKMRGLFVNRKEAAVLREDGEEHVHELQDSGEFKNALKIGARIAHFHLIAAAFRRLRADPLKLGNEPACVSEMVDKITMESDPRVPIALQFIDARVEFSPVRGPEAKGKMYFSWILKKDMDNAFWTWLDSNGKTRSDKFTEWKLILTRSMEIRQRRLLHVRPVCDGQQRGKVYLFNAVAWK